MTRELLLIDAYKIGACALLGIAVFVGVLSALLDVTGPLARAWQRYVTLLDRRLRELFLPSSGRRIATLQAVGLALLGALVFSVEIPYWYLPLLAAALGPFYYLERRKRQRKQELEKQLDPFILALANALKSIPSVNAAFQSVAETSPSPMREEIELANREMRVGSTLDEALWHLSARIGSPRLDSALAAVVLGRQIGGNLPRVLESTASSIREMSRLEGVLRTKTSEAKMQLYAIGGAPFFLVLVLSFISPGYFDPLQQSALGYMVGLGAVAAWVLALYLARQVLSVSL